MAVEQDFSTLINNKERGKWNSYPTSHLWFCFCLFKKISFFSIFIEHSDFFLKIKLLVRRIKRMKMEKMKDN